MCIAPYSSCRFQVTWCWPRCGHVIGHRSAAFGVVCVYQLVPRVPQSQTVSKNLERVLRGCTTIILVVSRWGRRDSFFCSRHQTDSKFFLPGTVSVPFVGSGAPRLLAINPFYSFVVGCD